MLSGWNQKGDFLVTKKNEMIKITINRGKFVFSGGNLNNFIIFIPKKNWYIKTYKEKLIFSKNFCYLIIWQSLFNYKKNFFKSNFLKKNKSFVFFIEFFQIGEFTLKSEMCWSIIKEKMIYSIPRSSGSPISCHSFALSRL